MVTVMDELAEYIVDFHTSFLTPTEQAAIRELRARGKRDSARRSGSTSVANMIEQRWISDDPEVAALADQGAQSLYLQIRDRVLREHGDELEFNRCPRCGGLCRTPKAKQCRHCFHDWH